MKIKATVFSVAALLMSAPFSAHAVLLSVSADFLDRGTTVAVESDLFGFKNNSDAGIQVASITIDMSNADFNFADFPLDANPHNPVFNTLDGCSALYCYGAAVGYAVTGLEPGATNTGFVAPSAGDQAAWEEATSLSLDFTDWDSGETFFFTTDLDDTFDFRVSGREFAYTTLTVLFVGQGLGPNGVEVTAEYFGDPNDLWRAVALVELEVAAIPVPAAVWLLGSGLVGLLGFRRKS